MKTKDSLWRLVSSLNKAITKAGGAVNNTIIETAVQSLGWHATPQRFWQSMATAPKDGSTILAVWKDDKRITMIEWFSIAGADGSWAQSVPGLGADHGYADDAFTHWMPLPEPPK